MRDTVVYTLMFSAMIQFFMAVYAWGRRNEPAAKPLFWFFTLGGVWAFAYGMEIAYPSLPVMMLWMKIYWTTSSFGPFLFLWIVLEHLEMGQWLNSRRVGILLIPSIIMIVLLWTSPYQDLLVYDFSIHQIGEVEVIKEKEGILYFPIFLALQGISIIAYYFLIRSFFYTTRIKNQQSIAILVALLIPFLVNMPAVLNLNFVTEFDFTPHALVLSSALFAYAIFRYRWLDIIPLAHSKLMETIPAGVVVTDARDRIVDINPFARDLLSLEDSDIGREAQVIFSWLDMKLSAHDDTQPINREITVKNSAEQRYVDVQIVPLKGQDGKFNGRIFTFQDVTGRKQDNQRLQVQLTEIASLHSQLREQAIHDPLTGLFNRRYMSDIFERESHRAERHQHPLSILMIEIDNFKSINDTYGHDIGDIALIQLADLIRSNTRTDDIPCRFGGDEFILLMPETPIDFARQCAERLREKISNLHITHNDGVIPSPTLSIGVSAYPEHGETMEEAIHAADKAMYKAKQSGKNRVIVANK